ncbi:MAG: metallophosphoesterase [Clostridia bacterium]|nr:metallophosphoesterase [Clostridia bacterium]
MIKTIFAVSDIHGHYTQFKKALEESGFERGCDDHLLVVCGDCFDRGRENKAVLEYLEGIDNKVVIRGNHEDLLLDALDTHKISYYDVHNGTDITIEEFLGADAIDRDGTIKRGTAGEKRLRSFIGGMVDYFETKNFVFTHGWIPLDDRGRTDGWRVATPRGWRHARFSEWTEMYTKGMTLPRKTIVCGHRSASYGHLFDPKRAASDSTPFFGEGMAAIDALTVLSSQVNILLIEDEVLLPCLTHYMNLHDEFFDAVKSDKKTVEMRVFDTRRRDVKIGDCIVFKRYLNQEDTVKVRVTGTHVYDSFEELTMDHKPSVLGFPGKSRSAIATKMKRLYDVKLAKCKPFAINIRLEE